MPRSDADLKRLEGKIDDLAEIVAGLGAAILGAGWFNEAIGSAPGIWWETHDDPPYEPYGLWTDHRPANRTVEPTAG